MRLLVVEDDENAAKNLKRLLESRGFAIDLLPNAEKAYPRILLYRQDYSLILLDLGLPGTGGLELTKSLRKEGITIPIIIITGRSETKDKIEVLNSGADDYVVKPFSSEELIARIHSVLRREPVVRPVVHKVGTLEIDTAARRVKSNGKEIPLTLKEYSLFECFIRRPNEVVRREELTDQVWDFNAVSWSNVLEVHIKNLRKKLGTDEDQARLETVRGVGYRLVV